MNLENIKTETNPTLLGRLLGYAKITLSYSDKISNISIADKKFESQSLKYDSWTISKKFFGFKIDLLNESQSQYSFKVSKNDLTAINDLLFQARYVENINNFCDNLEKAVSGDNYFSHNYLIKIQGEFRELLEILHENTYFSDKIFPINSLSNVKNFLGDYDQYRASYNDSFIKSESLKWNSLFERLEENPLTNKQIESVVTEEDATLVVAGAGTGKTSSVVGKIGYLIESERAKPEDILALAFNRDAAQEMRERVLEKTGNKVEIRTFHAFGKYLIENNLREKIKIADFERFERAKLAHINSLISEMYASENEARLIVNFLSYHRYPAKFREDFNQNKDYLSYLSKVEPVTLNDEWVKSFEEVLIADWLTIHGVKYEYERPYEYKTSSMKRRQYQPDFYLVDYDIYLEHFGIDKNGKTAPWIDSIVYNKSIKWKRDLHKKNKTKLIETYSWERMDGTLSKNLKIKLEDAGVNIEKIDIKELQKRFQERRVNERLVSLISDFLSVFKEGLWTIEELDQNIEKKNSSEFLRVKSFTEIFKSFYSKYQNHLSKKGEIDFADLIVKATNLIQTGKIKPTFSHIIVDEFQDISRGRSKFLKSIRQGNHDCKLMCVGDDWQSIYGFTGSDVQITTKFGENFGAFKRVDLDRTFRFRQPIIDASARFIQKNPSQLRKKIIGREGQSEKEIEVITASEIEIEEELFNLLKRIKREKSKGKKVSVLMLGRYNFTEPEFIEALSEKYNSIDVSFMTIHKSKGLQADYVVILGLENAKFGFPGSIATDPIMGLIRPSEEEYEDAEERRVFYVALTRAKEKVFLINPPNPSKFLTEIMNYEEVQLNNLSVNADCTCPECSSGDLILKFPNRKNGYAWKCSFGRYCKGEAKFCKACGRYPEINGKCVDTTCISHRDQKTK